MIVDVRKGLVRFLYIQPYGMTGVGVISLRLMGFKEYWNVRFKGKISVTYYISSKFKLGVRDVAK